MESYNEVIEAFMYQEFPGMQVSGNVQFEAIAAAVFGTKQRRFGPMPSPEVQVPIREYLRNNKEYHFFIPMGSSKLQKDANLDVLEYFMLKQLTCLQDELYRYGKRAKFHFRVEDVSDTYLFKDQRAGEIEKYRTSFGRLTNAMLPRTAEVWKESDIASYGEFADLVEKFTPVFVDYLYGVKSFEALRIIGWTGTIPDVQQEYYRRQFLMMYPDQDPVQLMSRYFAVTLARHKLRATCVPDVPHISIAFTHPIPGDPMPRQRVYYRALPEKYTNIHRTPWNAKGYFTIDEENCVKPKNATFQESLNYVPNVVSVNGVSVAADYVLV